MANPLSPTAAGGVHPVSSAPPRDPQSVQPQPVSNGRKVNAMVQTQFPDSAERVGFMRRLRCHLSELSKFSCLSQIRDKQSGSSNSSEEISQPSFKPVVVTVYHRPTLWERSVSALGKVARLIIAPARILVWKPLKFFCIKLSDATTYLFNHKKYAAAKKAELDIMSRDSQDHTRDANAQGLNAKARLQVVDQRLEVLTRDRMPYVKALDELKPILEQRRKKLEDKQPEFDEVAKFRELGVLPNGENQAFVNAMTEYNSKNAEYKAARAEYDAAVALAVKKGEQRPAPGIGIAEPVVPLFRCDRRDDGVEGIYEAFLATNDKPLMDQKAKLTNSLERLRGELIDAPDGEDCSEIRSLEHAKKLQAQIQVLVSSIEMDESALVNQAAHPQELQEKIATHKALIGHKQRLIKIFNVQGALDALEERLSPVQASREIDIQEWENGAFDEQTGEMLQGKRDRLSLNKIRLDKDNLKTDSHGNITHLAYVIDRPLINAVHQEHESREARNNGYVWRRAGANDRPNARYVAVVNDDTQVVTGSRPGQIERRHWYVRDEPVVHVEGYDKRRLAVTFPELSEE